MLAPFDRSDRWNHISTAVPPMVVAPGLETPPVFEDGSGYRIRIALKRHQRLYKFSEPKWIDKFFECGSVRIGTLFEYHDVPSDGGARQDDKEGLHEFIDRNRRLHVTPALNQWVFCAATSFNDSRRRRLGGAGYEIKDVKFFFEISAALTAAAGTQLRDPLLAAVEYRPPAAINRELGQGKFAGLVKRDIYDWQREARALWEHFEPRERHLKPWHESDVDAGVSSINDYIRRQKAVCQPVIVDVPDARKYCRRLLGG